MRYEKLGFEITILTDCSANLVDRIGQKYVGSASRKCGPCGPCGETSKSRRNNFTCIFLCKSAFYPNFLVLKAEKFALLWLQKCAQPLYISAFRLYRPAILDESHTLRYAQPIRCSSVSPT